jgi:putative AlgH/UPF0301 family transcriptional regulator
MSIVINRRSLKDDNLKVTKALPAAAANNTSDPIYIGGLGPHREGLKLRVSWPANTVLVANKKLTLTLYSAATTTLAAEADPAQTFVITGDTGFAKGYVDFELGQGVLAYVGWNQAVETGGGDNTGTSFTGEIVS